MRVDLEDLEGRLRELRAWADGYEEVNEGTARRVRALVSDVCVLVEDYRAEASGRVAMQTNYERCLAVISTRAYEIASRLPAPEERNPLLP